MTDMNSKQPNDDSTTTHDQVRRAMIEKGWLIPVTPEEVLIAESALLGEETSPPPSLDDAFAVLNGPSRQPTLPDPPISLPLDKSIAENLARAAREGKEISADIEAKMRADREAAERDADV